MLRTLQTIACLSLVSTPAWSLDIRSCVINPSQIIDIAVEIPGLVQEVMVDRGDTVGKGDVLLQLRDTSIRAQVALAQRRAEDTTQIKGVDARIEVITGQLERVRTLFGRDLIAQREVDRVEAELIGLYQERDRLQADQDMAAIEFARMKELLEQRIIRSPIEGFVMFRATDPGEYASEQTPVMTIAALHPLHVEIFVPQDMSGKLSLGQEIGVTLNTAADKTLLAKVAVIDQVFDAASGTFGVRLLLDNPDYSLPAGVRCQAHM